MDPLRIERLNHFVESQITFLNVEELIEELRYLKLINLNEKASLEKEATAKGIISAGSTLINLIKGKDNIAYDKLVAALESTGQEYLAHFLQHRLTPDTLLSKVDKQKIQENFAYFVENLQFQKIFPLLRQHQDYFTPSELAEFMREQNTVKQNDSFISRVIMHGGTYWHLTKFSEALKETNQGELVERLPLESDFLKFSSNDDAASSNVSSAPGKKPPRFSRNPPNKPPHMQQKEVTQGPEHLPIVKNIIFKMVYDKEYTPYDLWVYLKKFKGKVYDTPNQLRNEDGFNLLHYSVDKGRLSILTTILQMGWWKVLSEQKVNTDSQNEHRGKYPKQIAEVKRTRKTLDEVNQFTEWENSLSPIMKACRIGDTRKVSRELTLEGSIAEALHYNDGNGGNALYWAVVGGDEKILNLLLDAGLDSSKRTKKNETLLHTACSLGHHHLLTKLLSCGLDLGIKDHNNKTAYDRIAENGDIDSLIVMMKNEKFPDPTFPVLTSYSGRRNCLEYCIEALKMDVDCKDMYSRTPLHRAIEGCKLDITKYLVEKGANLVELTCSLRNVLHIAAESGSNPICKLLIGELKKKGILETLINEPDRYNGVDLCFLIRGRDRARDAWHYVEVGRAKVPLFLKKTKTGNVDVAAFGNVIKSGWGVNPNQDNVDEIEEMFKTKRLDTTAPRDMTPLQIAIFKGNIDTAKLLLDEGAKVNVKDKFNITPLMMACAKGYLNLVKDLERKGARLKDINSDGKTALEVAQENENEDIVNYMQGRDYYQMCNNFLEGDLKKLKEELSNARLHETRSQGHDVKEHLVNTLRGFKIDINQFLMDLGSGPVLEASDP